MIASVARLSRWEWFKLRRRWMPWILLAIFVLFAQLTVWAPLLNFQRLHGDVTLGAGVGKSLASISCAEILAEPPRALPVSVTPTVLEALRAQCRQLAQQREERLRQIYANFTLPGSIEHSLTSSAAILFILLTILAASTIGVEYAWGTMRSTLIRGTGRWQYLAGKLVLLLLVTFGALLVASALSVVSSLIAPMFADAPAGFSAPSWWSAPAALGRTWYGMVPLITLAALVSVATASSAIGMAIGIGYYIAEPLVVALLDQISDRLSAVSDYLLAANVRGWIGTTGIAGAPQEGVSAPHHFIVLLVYTLAFTAVAVWMIERRDVTKATGT